MSAIIEKVRKLLNVADPRSGATEAEMATALMHANALMMKHNIDQADLVLVTEELGIIKVPGEVDEEYHHLAACAAGLLNMCKPLRFRDEGAWGFSGRKSNIEAAAMMYPYIVGRVEALYRQHLPPRMTKADRANFRRTFKQACAGRVLRRAMSIIDALSRDDGAAMAATGKNALVVQTTVKQRLDEAAEHAKSSMQLKPMKAKKHTIGLGSVAGHMAGDQIELQKAVK